MFRLLSFDNNEHFERGVFNEIVALIDFAIEQKGFATIGLSGGNTPGPIYSMLGKSNLDFSKIFCFAVDERYVPHDNAESNFDLIKNTIFAGNNAKYLSNLHDFDTSLSIENALSKYSEELKRSSKFDLMILGIGEDGHFASVFPFSETIHSKELTAHTQTEKFAIKDRFTMTPNFIMSAENIFVLLKNKSEVMEELLNGKKSTDAFPAKLLLEKATFFDCRSK